MLSWYERLYVGETVKKKEKRLVRKISGGRGSRGVYLVTLATNGKDQLDIISAAQAVRRERREIAAQVVGLAGSYSEALELVEAMAREAFEQTGEADIRGYLIKREREGK